MDGAKGSRDAAPGLDCGSTADRAPRLATRAWVASAKSASRSVELDAASQWSAGYSFSCARAIELASFVTGIVVVFLQEDATITPAQRAHWWSRSSTMGLGRGPTLTGFPRASSPRRRPYLRRLLLGRSDRDVGAVVESDGTIAGRFDDTVVDDPVLKARKGFIRSPGLPSRVFQDPGAGQTFVLARGAAGRIVGFITMGPAVTARRASSGSPSGAA